jgi:glycine/D-amino acid oxidase-like deaminating enzyme
MPDSDRQPATAVVVGGGVVGVSTARHLVRAGISTTLVTDGPLGSGASGRSLSWLNSAGVKSDAYHRLRMAGIDRYRTLKARHPGVDWLRFDGALSWTTADRAESALHGHEHEVAVGYDSRLLSPAEVAAEVPGVDPDAVTGPATWHPGDGWVDLPSLVDHLAAEFTAAGGRLLTGAGGCSLLTSGDAVTGVRTAAGEPIEADATVLAAGAAVPGLAAEAGVKIPDDTPLAFLVTTEPVETALTAVVNTPRVSLRPAPGGRIQADSDWTTAHIRGDAETGYRIDEEIVEELLAAASAVLDGHPRLRPARRGIGPKPVPGDGQPVLGGVDGVPGLRLAFTHSGATLGLIAGELLAYEIANGAEHPMLAPFNLRRFG